MPRPSPGDVWLADLGHTAKVRPVLLLSRYPADDELALMVIVPHTTAIRGNRREFDAGLPFLDPGVFHLQQVQSVSLSRPVKKPGTMPSTGLGTLRRRLATELDLA